MCGACGASALDAEAIHAELLAARGGTALRELATRLAAHGDAAVPVLVRWLDDPARNVRETAAHALGNLAPRTPEVVKALAARLEDPDDYVRWKVIRALGRQRGVAREYLPRFAPSPRPRARPKWSAPPPSARSSRSRRVRSWQGVG
ncbi:MAG: HEAT repeat domain-containing protein [Planctomycetota bacterium]